MKTEYLSNDIKNPKYLFHGSSRKLDVIKQRQATDSNHNPYNEDFAVFLTSSFIAASAYAFIEKIKEISSKDSSFEIGYEPLEDKIYINFENVNIDDDIEGYVYVFEYSDKYEHQGRSIQYKSHENIIPIDTIEIKFSDYKQYYKIEDSVNKIY